MFRTTLVKNPEWVPGSGTMDRVCRYVGMIEHEGRSLGWVQLWPTYLVVDGERIGSRLPKLRIKLADERCKLQTVQVGKSIMGAAGRIGEFRIEALLKKKTDRRRRKGDQGVLLCVIRLTEAEEAVEDVWFATPETKFLDLDEAARFFPDADG